MTSKYVTDIILQGNYGHGWEDIMSCENDKEAKSYLKDYDENENYPHRIIRRKVLDPEYEKTLTDIDVIEYRWGTRGAVPAALAFYVPQEHQWYNFKGSTGNGYGQYHYILSSVVPTDKKYYKDGYTITKEKRKTYKCEGNSLESIIKCLQKHYSIYDAEGETMNGRLKTHPKKTCKPAYKKMIGNISYLKNSTKRMI